MCWWKKSKAIKDDSFWVDVDNTVDDDVWVNDADVGNGTAAVGIGVGNEVECCNNGDVTVGAGNIAVVDESGVFDELFLRLFLSLIDPLCSFFSSF